MLPRLAACFRSIKDEENEAALAETHDSWEKLPPFPVFALLGIKTAVIVRAGGITCLRALPPLLQPRDERQIDEDALG